LQSLSTFVAEVPDAQTRRAVIGNATKKKLYAAFRNAVSLWESTAKRHEEAHELLQRALRNQPPCGNNPIDRGLLARSVGFTVRVPWRLGNTSVRSTTENNITIDELRDELMDVLDARELFMARHKELKHEIRVIQADNKQQDEQQQQAERARLQQQQAENKGRDRQQQQAGRTRQQEEPGAEFAGQQQQQVVFAPLQLQLQQQDDAVSTRQQQQQAEYAHWLQQHEVVLARWRQDQQARRDHANEQFDMTNW
jgi:hypothetical protein